MRFCWRPDMASVRDVATHFLTIATADEDAEGLTHLKLQKLLYYAQGFHLAIFGQPLFPDEIQAWDHGPVVSSMWAVFRQYGNMPIPAPEGDCVTSLTEEQRDLLNDVWNAYGQFSAWKLRNMTHAETPWRNTYQRGKNVPITGDVLTQYFRTQVTDGEAA